MFLFSILGNTTYALSILAKSMDWAYLTTNAGWLAGSGLTVFLDALVSALGRTEMWKLTGMAGPLSIYVLPQCE
jgi:hypothetical protein